MRHPTFCMTVLALALAATPALAQQPDTSQPLAWDQLTEQQRQTLIAPLRDRWDSAPDKRAHMLQRAERWQQMTPEQRERAQHGMKRWQHMSPEGRAEARALYEHLRTLPPDEREAMRERWKTMDAGQRRAWLLERERATP